MNKYKKIIPIVILASLFFFSISRMNNQHCCNHLKPMITKSNPTQSPVKKENKETKKPKKQRNKYSR